MKEKIEEFVAALNAAYTARGVNGVAVAIQTSRHSWAIKCEFETHFETYLVGQDRGGVWNFIRVMTEEELYGR